MMPKLPLLALLFATCRVDAALFYSVETDASGAFVNSAGAPATGSWSGDGTAVGPAGYGTTSGATMINDFKSGVLDPGSIATFFGGASLGMPPVGNLNYNTGVGAEIDFTISGAGATGDLFVNNFNHPNGNGYATGFGVNDLMNATGLSVEFNWDQPLAATFATLPNSSNPFLAAVRMQGAAEGTGTPTSSWDITATYLGLRHTTGTNPATAIFTPGIPSSAVGIDLQNSQTSWGSSGASASWTANNTGGNDWQGIHAFDQTGGTLDPGINNSNFLEDAEQVYATGIRFDFAPTTGGFLDGSSFIFSTQGGQWRESIDSALTIPEPSRALMLLAGLVGLSVARRRR